MSTQNINSWSIEWAGRELTVETGKLAMQADGACTVQYGDTKLLATAVRSDEPQEGQGYFPLTVEFQEKLYASGKIKGSRFVKREGKPADQTVTTSRVIDRAIRPLFDQDIRHDVQIVITPFSVDEETDTEVTALIGATIALSISDIPWAGPIGTARVGMQEGEFILNPTKKQIEAGQLDLIVSGSPESLIMTEARSKEVSENKMKEAMKWGCKRVEPVIELIENIQSKIGDSKVDLLKDLDKHQDGSKFQQAKRKAAEFVDNNAEEMMYDRERSGRKERIAMVENIKEEIREKLSEQEFEEEEIDFALDKTEKIISKKVMEKIIKDQQRLDGRDLDGVRPLTIDTNLIPSIHGSALFQRGDTQILETITLGAPGKEQTLETMEQDKKKKYMHHYFDAPFTYGGTGYMGAPGRREIGHGMLAESALRPVLPDEEEFPYAVRSVSEVLSSNGSSSMGSICGSSLALMSAGVPIKKPVAGIAMGLASTGKVSKNEGEWKVITDLQDVEDGPGGMDFKIGGTRDGITVVQMDTKTEGLNWDIVDEALKGAKDARLRILDEMDEVISEPTQEISKDAPRIETIDIDPDKIGDIIGPGGETIQEITEKTGVEIDIEDEGRVIVTADNKEDLDQAMKIINVITHEVEPGETYTGEVTRIEDFGAFVKILPGKKGLVHISEFEEDRTENVRDVVNMGDKVKVKVKEIDDMDRINLTMKGVK
ncbi:MAG: polyribonucleotide nucleotidyltransferase [Parcubacteria group bacterium QH_9_35_7]|nr:MAG: polyribonucleotide nucleotidyltransferase [Parcubacteria group bacterium QH_9_35_7]